MLDSKEHLGFKMEGSASNQKLILNQSQRDYYKNRKDRPASSQRKEGE